MKNINEKKIIQNIIEMTGDLSKYKMLQGLEIIKGIGDDAAYWKSGDFGYCVTSDTLVENVHFKSIYFSATLLNSSAPTSICSCKFLFLSFCVFNAFSALVNLFLS